MSQFVLIARFEAKPRREEALRRELDAMVEPSLAEDGCLGYRPYLSPNDPSRMIIVEEWASQAALDQHFQTPHFKRAADALGDILAEPFSLTRLERTDPVSS